MTNICAYCAEITTDELDFLYESCNRCEEELKEQDI
jgi:hypothetical protein